MADVTEEEQFILQSTKYLANDQVGAFYLSKKNPFPMRHFSNPKRISINVLQARHALAKHMAERAFEDQPAPLHSQSAVARQQLFPCEVGNIQPRPRTSYSGQPLRRQVHFEYDQKSTNSTEATETDDDMPCREHGRKITKTPISKTLEANLERRPLSSSFRQRSASNPLDGRISDWVPDRLIIHSEIRRTQSFHPQNSNEFKRMRSQSISVPEGRIMKEMRQEKDAAEEKVKVFLSTLKEEGLANELHTPKPITYYRHVSMPGPKDYWRRLGEKVMQEQEVERRKSQQHMVEHQLQTVDRAKKHSVTKKLQNVVKKMLSTKRTCELLEYAKMKQEMLEPKMKETPTPTLTSMQMQADTLLGGSLNIAGTIEGL